MNRAWVICIFATSFACSTSENRPPTGSATGSAGTSGVAGSTGAAGTTGSAGKNGNAGVTGTAGTTGQAGASGAAGTTGAAGMAMGGFMGTVDLGNSVLERGGNPQRTATWVQPTLTKANVMTKMAQDANFKATFNGGLQGVPLFVASSMAGKGMFIAATNNSNVYALDETTGATLWSHSIGTGGHGIISTPVIDAAPRKIF